MKLHVDGCEVEAGDASTLLDACRAAGADVPALCHDPRLPARGRCRACMVEVGGHLVAACSTPAVDGMDVATASARVRDYRRDLGELMLVESSPAGEAGALLRRWGADGWRYAAASPPPLAEAVCDSTHPLLSIDLGACIRCRRCSDVCAAVQGEFVWAAEGRGAATRMAWGGGHFADSGCVACGACAAACPSGAIVDPDRVRAVPGAAAGHATPASRVVRTTCPYCGVGCAMDVHVSGDDVVRVDGVDAPPSHGQLCVKGRYAHGFARHRDRLRTPLLRRDGRLVPVSWDEALDAVAQGMQRLRGRVGLLSSSRCTNEENYLLQKWARAGLATNNVDCCARVCHAPSAAGMRLSLGTGAATNSFADLDAADCLLVVGSNTTASHPVLGAGVRQRVLSGAASLVVVDPRRTPLAAMAGVHLAPRPGTNVPLLHSLAAALLDQGLAHGDFVAARTRGFDEYARFVVDFLPEATEAVTGVPAALVREAATLYGGARSPMQMHGLGVTEHLQGSEAVRLLCNLALLVGGIGREGTGVNPLRGQNNVQGAADMGCQPDFLPGYAPVPDQAVRARLAKLWGSEPPAEPGLALPDMLEAIDHGGIAGLFVMGEDLVQTDPDSNRVRERLARLELLVVQEIFPSATTELAHVVLPGASAFEKDGTFTNGERRVQRVRRALEPLAGCRTDHEVLLDLMRRSGMAVGSPGAREVFDEIRAAWPALAEASWEALDAEGLQWPVARASQHTVAQGLPGPLAESSPVGAQALPRRSVASPVTMTGLPHDSLAPPVGTPVLHRDSFPLPPDGRAVFACVPFVPSPEAGAGPLTLVTGRVLEHYNSGSMTRRSGLEALVGCDELEIHPRDAAARGIRSGDAVRVRSEWGEAEAVARLTHEVRPGDVFLSFHFPGTGTNRVTSPVADRLTGCPEYKVTAVEVEKASPGRR